MFIDYLRYQAFSGRLQGFFEEDISKYVDPEHSTGQHLRFAPGWINSSWGFRNYNLIHELYIGSHYSPFAIERALDGMGLARYPDILMRPSMVIGGKPPTYRYEDLGSTMLEIIVDIDPRHWSERYLEPQSYEGTRIIYRRSAPARANFSAGDRLVDKLHKQGGYGTLCGIFETENDLAFGLTCGHVTRKEGEVLIEHPRRFWRFELGSTFDPFGSTKYYTIPGPDMKIGGITTRLDAALVACSNPIVRLRGAAAIGQSIIKPISSVLQEEPVKFRGASRQRPAFAKISAITVRKSIDLFNDGNLYYLGDVLMLGHRERMYITQPISYPGDSGSAVCSGQPESSPSERINQWYGMVLGGDEQSAYASHAECIWSWVADTLSPRRLSFYL